LAAAATGCRCRNEQMIMAKPVRKRAATAAVEPAPVRPGTRKASPAKRAPQPPAALKRARRAAGAPGLAEQARTELEEMIVKLELPPGSVWSEAHLSQLLGIGRTPVREALQRLQSDHLVKILPRYGAQITEINVTQQLLLVELRRVLERLIAETAARRATPEEREQLLGMADELEAMVDGDVMRFLRYHNEIKRFIAACARNPYSASAIAPANAMARRFYFLHYRVAHDLPVAAKHHANVIRAIALGDEARAGMAAERLIGYVEEITRATVSQGL
jgi:DNA-binding GntR family transcriptional regulator